MNADEVAKLDYGKAMIVIGDFTYTIMNKFYAEFLGLKAGDKLVIKWLGMLEIVCVIRAPIYNVLNRQVQEVKFICKRVNML